MIFEWLSFLLGKLTFFAGAVIGGSSFPRPLSADEEAKTIALMKNGDKSAREKLISHNMRLVAHVVKKYSGAMETDDLISVGSIGLIKAVDSYDEKKGSGLATYTVRCIENEILMLLRSNKKFRNDVSLNEPVGSDKDGNELTIIDLLYDETDEVFSRVDKSVESEKLIKFLKKTLSPREFTVMSLRFGLKGERSYAQREVASFLKISRSYISRIEKKSIEKLREAIKNGEFSC